jgi:hypothetical protein
MSAHLQGHFRHANAQGLQQTILRRHRWLATLANAKRRFSYRLEGKGLRIEVSHG